MVIHWLICWPGSDTHHPILSASAELTIKTCLVLEEQENMRRANSWMLVRTGPAIACGCLLYHGSLFHTSLMWIHISVCIKFRCWSFGPRNIGTGCLPSPQVPSVEESGGARVVKIVSRKTGKYRCWFISCTWNSAGWTLSMFLPLEGRSVPTWGAEFDFCTVQPVHCCPPGCSLWKSSFPLLPLT